MTLFYHVVLSIIYYKQEYFEFKSIAFPFLSMFLHFYALFCFRHIYLIRKCFQNVLKMPFVANYRECALKVNFFLAMNLFCHVTNV